MIKNFNRYYKKDIPYKAYVKEKNRLQVELLKLQEWIIKEKKKLAIVFEGRDAAGKGGTIKRFVEYLIPKNAKVVELGIPTKKQSKNWFKTYEKLLPKPGKIVFFDRSWYSRSTIQPSMGYCNKSQYDYFMKKVNKWEKKLINNELILLKIYLSVNKNIQNFRFETRMTSKLKYWKLSDNDIVAQNKWNVFTNFKDQMFQKTSTTIAPWVLIKSNNKLVARLNAMRYVLNSIEYKGKKPLKEIKWTKEKLPNKIEIMGVPFKNLTSEQYSLLEQIINNG